MTGADGLAAVRPTGLRRVTPAAALLLLAPVIGELLGGAIRLSYIFALVPAIMVWGCGALMIREVVHRWRGGWTSILVMGLGLSIAWEFIIQQTSLAPLPWLGSTPVYDRVLGINWIWFFFMLGYEAVWIVLVPILLTELIFPQQRDEAWLRPRGMAAAALVFALGSLIMWSLWTQITMPVVFHMPKYQPPLSTLLLGLLAILLLVMVAFALRTLPEGLTVLPRRSPPPWIVGLTAMAFGFPWWVLMALIFAPRPSLPLWLPLIGGSVWAAVAFLVIRRWSRASGWNDRHRWALAFAALLVCILAGFLGSSLWPTIDLVGKVALNAIAVVGMIFLARGIWRREVPAP